MAPEDVLNDPTEAVTAEVQRILAEAHEAVKVFQEVQAQAARNRNADVKANLAALKSNELARLKNRLPNIGERIAAVTAGLRDRMDTAKTADKALDAAINALGKRINELRR
jgi:hypothetical protein